MISMKSLKKKVIKEIKLFAKYLYSYKDYRMLYRIYERHNALTEGKKI
jgi:hypothetical protein